MPVTTQLDKLTQYNAPPSLLGFGISEPEQVKQAIASGAAGAISGSAVVKIIESNQDNFDEMLNKLAQFTQNMKAATHK
jgi:tryptophan synthase alpha chain